MVLPKVVIRVYALKTGSKIGVASEKSLKKGKIK